MSRLGLGRLEGVVVVFAAYWVSFFSSPPSSWGFLSVSYSFRDLLFLVLSDGAEALPGLYSL